MKKALPTLLILIFLFAQYAFAITDDELNSMSIKELRDLQTRISSIIVDKNSVEQASDVVMPKGKTIRELFPDIEFAKVIRSSLNMTSIDNIVTQEDLDSITQLKLTRNNSNAIYSLEGISFLRNLQVFEIYCGFSSAYGADYRFKDEYCVYTGTSLPEEIGNLQHLTSISLQDVAITELPESMRNLVELTTLEIYNTNLRCIPEWIGDLVSLKNLSFRQSFVLNIPESIGQLTALNELVLTDSEISSIPDSICMLPNIQELDFGYTNLQSLPEQIGNLSTLKVLKVNNTPITKLPTSINKLHLTELNIDKTAIE